MTEAKKPRIFVGSSSEGLEHAKAVEAYLSDDFDVLLWTRGLFRPGLYNLEALEEAIHAVTFAVIVGTPDDVLVKRGVTNSTIRDNLILELGLFIGRLGRKRTLLLVPKAVDLSLPSDLLGLSHAEYDARASTQLTKEVLRALQAGASEIRRALLHEAHEERRIQGEREASLMRSERLQAVGRIMRAVIQLRDICVELPGRVLDSLSDKSKFDEVKVEASRQVAVLHDGWIEDARLMGVTEPLAALVAATRATIEAFPYPAVVVSDQDAASVAKRMLGKGIGAYQTGDGFSGATEAAAGELFGEVETKLVELGEQYRRWWNEQAAKLRPLTYRVLDSLSQSAVALGLSQTAERNT